MRGPSEASRSARDQRQAAAHGPPTDTYNYERFDVYVESGEDDREFGNFPNTLHAGERAPSGELTRLDDGARVRLSDLWRRGGIVLEFGSFT